MATFPAVPNPIDPVIITPVWKTLIAGVDSAAEQRRSKWTFPKYNVTLTYELVTPRSQMQILYDFYMARKGAYEAFFFVSRYVGDHKNQYVGEGNDSTTIFDLPCIQAATVTIYNNGTPVSSEDYTILQGGGESGADRVQFDAAPNIGEVITADFTGYLRNRCRFAEDKMSESRFYQTCFSTGLELKGLRFKL